MLILCLLGLHQWGIPTGFTVPVTQQCRVCRKIRIIPLTNTKDTGGE
ncbi:hypothetical protein LCGC14_0741030 [marine sediment metagenome]|uniref:Uncharacterized protein n=1 Tax=marine sediment metagenome TaxID=412755 RepID=A0A0F9TDW0_9ZZZZ